MPIFIPVMVKYIQMSQNYGSQIASMPAKTKKGKLFIIFGAILLVAAIVVVLIFSNSNKAQNQQLQAVINLIENGTTANTSDYDDEQTLYAVAIADNLGDSQIDEYYKILDAEVEKLLSENNTEKAKTLSRYEKILKYTVNYRNEIEKLKKIYDAEEYGAVAKTILSYDFDDISLKPAIQKYINYYNDAIDQYDYFYKYKCIEGGSYSKDCARTMHMDMNKVYTYDEKIMEDRVVLEDERNLQTINMVIKDMITKMKDE